MVRMRQGKLGSDIYDINGREIFEGDKIVFVGDGDVYEVTFSEGAFRVEGHPLCNFHEDQFEIVERYACATRVVSG